MSKPQLGVSIGDVARAAGLSTEGVRQHDGELRPIRTASGHRRYTVEAVERFIAKRAAAKR